MQFTFMKKIASFNLKKKKKSLDWMTTCIPWTTLSKKQPLIFSHKMTFWLHIEYNKQSLIFTNKNISSISKDKDETPQTTIIKINTIP